MALIRMILWLALFLASTFAFHVLFEHGPTNYSANAAKEWKNLQTMVQEKTGSGGEAKK